MAVLTRKALRRRYPSRPLEYRSIRARDMRPWGGPDTKPLKPLFKKGSLPDGAVVILSGGEILGATWHRTHRDLSSPIFDFILRGLMRVLPVSHLNRIARMRFGLPLDHPWIIGPRDFKDRAVICYSAAGGAALSRSDPAWQAGLTDRLKNVAYLSVRDRHTKKTLDHHLSPGHVRLAPDTGILASRYFPMPDLIRRVTDETRYLCREKYSDGFICFQVNDRVGLRHTGQIVQEMTAIHQKTRLPFVLLPTGRAVGHRDGVPLKKIKSRLTNISVLPSDRNGIFDIMYLIASSRLFIGTSFHGNLTALSFGVPHLCLGAHIPKSRAFFETWGVEETKQPVSAESFADRASVILSVPSVVWQAQRDKLVRLAEENLDKLFEVMDG